MSDAREIAANLTKAQREALLDLPISDAGGDLIDRAKVG